jgi:hypothetical protein
MTNRIKTDKIRILLLGLILVYQLLIYLPHVGTGFIKDDFVWLENVTTDGKVEYLKPFSVSTGFYRPLISLTFGLQFYFHGMNSFYYGLFNLLIHLLNIIMVFLIFNSYKTMKPYALFIVFLFSMNVKSVAMAVCWISGRTTLLFTFFTLLSLYLYRKERQNGSKKPWNIKKFVFHFFIGVFYLAALLSKENAIIVPVFVFLFWLFIKGEKSKKQIFNVFKSILVFFPPLIVYFILRLRSDAFTPFNAPEYYSFKIIPLIFLKNMWEYVTRAGLFDLAVTIWFFILIMYLKKTKKLFQGILYRNILAGSLWFFVFLLPVSFLVIRSNLYVYFPQIGYHLIFVVLIIHFWKQLDLNKAGRKNVFFVIIPLILLFFSWSAYHFKKAESYERAGRSSTGFIQKIIKEVPEISHRSQVFIIDPDGNNRFSPSQTVSYGLNSVFKLLYYYPYKKISGEIISPEELIKIRSVKNVFKFFFWTGGQLLGPFNCAELRNIMAIFWPYKMELPILEVKKKKNVKSKLSRSQKRRQGC